MEKAKRAVNFTNSECEILLSLVEKHINIIENKQTDAVMWKEKNRIWDLLTIEFNSLSKETVRTAKMLRTKYDLMKKMAKKELAEERELLKTGDGPPKRISSFTNRIRQLINMSVEGLSNSLNSDTAEVTNSNSSTTNVTVDISDFPSDIENGVVNTNNWSSWSTVTIKQSVSQHLQVPETNSVCNNENVISLDTEDNANGIPVNSSNLNLHDSDKSMSESNFTENNSVTQINKKTVNFKKKKSTSSTNKKRKKFSLLADAKLELVKLLNQILKTEVENKLKAEKEKLKIENLKQQHLIYMEQLKEQNLRNEFLKEEHKMKMEILKFDLEIKKKKLNML